MKLKISSAEKRLIAVSLLALGIIGGGVLWRNYLNREPVLNIPPYPKLPNPNGFGLYVQAARSLKPATPPVDEINDSNPPTDPTVRAKQYSLARKEMWLNQNLAAFALFQTALRTPCLHPPDRGSRARVFPVYSRLRELARCKRSESGTYEMRREWNRAVHSRIDVVQMGNEVSRGGPLIASLVGIAVQSIGRSEQWTLTDKLNAAQCRAAVDRLQRIYAQRVKLDAVLTEEKYVGQVQLVNSMQPGGWRMAFWRMTADAYIPFQERSRIFFVSKRTIINNYVENMDTLIAIAKLPYMAARKPQLQSDPINDTLMPVFERASFNFARNDAGNALWLVSLALRAYKLENGAYPVELKDLVPRYLKQIPADSFGRGGPLRYAKRASRYVLYSIGPDRVDNGGSAVPSRYKGFAATHPRFPQIDFDSTGDYVAGRNR
jgi:hypothetical protein